MKKIKEPILYTIILITHMGNQVIIQKALATRQNIKRDTLSKNNLQATGPKARIFL